MAWEQGQGRSLTSHLCRGSKHLTVDLETARYDIHTQWMAIVICFVWVPGKPERVHVENYEEYLHEHDSHQNVTNHSTALGHRTC